MTKTFDLLQRVAVLLDGLCVTSLPVRLFDEYEALRRETAPYLSKETTMTDGFSTETRSYLDTVSRAVFDLNEGRIEEIAGLIAKGAEEGSLLLVAGNGGSFCTALHLATDLEKCVCDALPEEQRGPSVTPRVRVLGENPGVWSAWINDRGSTGALARQVEVWGTTGSLLLLLSASGESTNLIQAASAAKKRGLRVAALIGRADSSLEQWADVGMVVGTEDVQVAEDVHSVCCHSIFRETLRRIKEQCGVKG